MKRSDDGGLSKRFCIFMARGYPPEEAARRAGYRAADCGWLAAELLSQTRIRRKIAQLCKELSFRTAGQTARTGLERLALGEPQGVSDLLFFDGDSIPANAELFHISEIKRPKGGGVEIKFFDRLRALSLLAELKEEEPGAGTLLSVLASSAAALGSGGDEPEKSGGEEDGDGGQL